MLGDEIVSDANMVFDHVTVIDAPAEQIWPWLLQLGKRRAGWYLPAGLERVVPEGRRALRTIDPRWQSLAVGDRIPDYGGSTEWLEVVQLDAPHTLVYVTERSGRTFTWALLLSSAAPGTTELRLRFRGVLRSHGIKRRLIRNVAHFFDWSTGKLMVLGLQKRLAGEGPDTRVEEGSTVQPLCSD